MFYLLELGLNDKIFMFKLEFIIEGVKGLNKRLIYFNLIMFLKCNKIY